MTVQLALTIEQETQLRQAAHLRGLDTDYPLHEVVDAALAQIGHNKQSQPVSDQLTSRIPDLHTVLTRVNDDFHAPLLDRFWLREE
ncbi:MAG: hypothetical protein ACRYFS_23870 [Janthinobacterium lividum]